jgi:hypothetical protein
MKPIEKAAVIMCWSGTGMAALILIWAVITWLTPFTLV